MENVSMKVNGDTLTITVDLTHNGGRSKSGKTLIIASSRGNQKVPDSDAIIGLNIYRKA